MGVCVLTGLDGVNTEWIEVVDFGHDKGELTISLKLVEQSLCKIE